MNIQNAIIGLPADFRAAAGRLFLSGAAEFASTLNLGQILKGKVMRHFEGGRYLVNFNGHERVVDSSVPLTTGELIHGRVVGLGERVELQRVHSADEAPRAAEPARTPEPPVASIRQSRMIDELAGRFRAQLDATDKATLLRAARLAADPAAMTLVGVMVQKLGLQQSPALLWPVYRALVRENATSAALHTGTDVPRLAVVAAADANVQAQTVRQLADVLVKQTEPRAQPQKAADAGSNHAATADRAAAATPFAVTAVRRQTDPDGGDGADPRALAHRLLNAQTGGSVAHRLGTVPMLLGDQLVEVDLSFFEQHKERPGAPGNKHRKVVFALRLERLGHVEIIASLAGSRVRLHVATGDEAATAAAAAHAETLRAALAEGGWEVDEVAYATRQADNQNGAVRAVVDHVVRQDSLNRLV